MGTHKPPLDRTALPEPVFDENPEWIAFYWRAWELAWDHVIEKKGAPASPYMDEAFSETTIWIWDTCFMVHFCKFAPQLFPGIQSFDNFYLPLHDNISSPLKIHHPDNPPLFAWIEYAYFQYTGDQERIARILPYLQKHYDFIEQSKEGEKLAGTGCPLSAQREPNGYRWKGCPSGMDNTPRGRDRYHDILWVDLLAQQGLAAKYISLLAKQIGLTALAETYQHKHTELKALAQKYYWNEEDGTFYDILRRDPNQQVKVKTPAAYWALLADFCNPEQSAKLAALAENPLDGFGGEIPWPSVPPQDPDFDPDGCYWRGGVWLPMVYMATCALRESGYAEIADPLAERTLEHMFQTWKGFEPHTIWEAYSPTQPEPSTIKTEDNGRFVRPDFCGWSALGPISLLIESVIGIHSADCSTNTLHWRIHRTSRHGINRFRFGEIVCDLLYEEGECTVTASAPFTLIINGTAHPIQAGCQQFRP
ncbi:trehalase family glycosidase [Kiritimatiellaeota bacterium B1221]|nr:trehalase family glycosidase [Kiritimatiellaeota bacterium B1221]